MNLNILFWKYKTKNMLILAKMSGRYLFLNKYLLVQHVNWLSMSLVLLYFFLYNIYTKKSICFWVLNKIMKKNVQNKEYRYKRKNYISCSPFVPIYYYGLFIYNLFIIRAALPYTTTVNIKWKGFETISLVITTIPIIISYTIMWYT